MQQVGLGHTGVSVSEVCLGTLHFGSNTPADRSLALLDAFVEMGGNFIDTANIYNRDAPGCSGGESEQLLGQWMKDRGNRERLFLATKVGMVYPGQEAGLRASQIREECDKSLKRLQVDRIDLYYAHWDDRETPVEETLAAFDSLVRAGKVRFIGASNFLPSRLADARWLSRVNGWASYCCIQDRYSFLRPRPGANFGHQKAANEDLLDYCFRENVPLIGFAPLLKGAIAGRADKPLAGNYQGEDSVTRLALLKEVAQELQVSPAQITLAWMRHHPCTIIPLIGVSTLEQLKDNLAALECSLDPGHMKRLDF